VGYFDISRLSLNNTLYRSRSYFRYKGLVSKSLTFIDMQVLSVKILYRNLSIEKVKLQSLSEGLNFGIEELFLACAAAMNASNQSDWGNDPQSTCSYSVFSLKSRSDRFMCNRPAQRTGPYVRASSFGVWQRPRVRKMLPSSII
jgi:hypothetical protein